jgi:amidase
MVPVAHANDGGGSIRIPASCCGLVGLKPTRARVSLAPQYGDLMGGLVAEHVVTRSVRDSAAVLDAIAGPVPGDPYWAPPRRGPSFAAAARTEPRALRVAVLTASPTGSAVHPDCVRATEETATLCEALGHHTEPAVLDVDGDAFTEHFINVWAAANAWTLLDWEHRVGRSATEDDLEPLTWALVQLGRSLDSGRYLRSVQELQKITRQIAEYFEGIDVLLTPTLGEPPAPLGTFDSPPGEPLTGLFRAAAYVPFTPPFNVTGQPGISLPLHENVGGLPIGVQFVGRFGDEETLLSLAGQLETAAPWADRRPPTSA